MKIRVFLAVFVSVCLLVWPFVAEGAKKGAEKRKQKKSKNKTEELFALEQTPAAIFAIPSAPDQAEKAPQEKTEETEGAIRGRVLNESGAPLARAEVLCINREGVVVAKTLTDSKGFYAFTGLEKSEYTISVNYSGIAGPLEIRFPDGREKPPPAPGRIVVAELDRESPGASYLRAQWEKVARAQAYRSELFEKGKEGPLVRRPDMIQTFCEFENLREDTEYEVRVYTKNGAGYSQGYASASIRTVPKPPVSPTGLGVTYAGNNRVDLVWNGGRGANNRGYLIQVKKGDGSYMYLGKGALTPDRNKALLVEEPGGGFVEHSIGENLDGKTQLLENLAAYSFRVMALDRRGVYSKASLPVTDIILEDTVPPRSPEKVKYDFIGSGKLKISWESPDSDVAKYRVSYGVNPGRWDEVAYTQKPSYELVYNKTQLRDKTLFVLVTAIDRAGNESGYRPVEKREVAADGNGRAGDVVVPSDKAYKDYSVALRPPAGAQKGKALPGVPEGAGGERRPASVKTFGFSELKAQGFVVRKGETARIDRDAVLPENAIIKVFSGGSLIVENARLAAEQGVWGGIRFLEGSTGHVKNAALSGAAVGIAVIDSDGGVSVSNVEVLDCAENGIYIKNSKIDLSFVSLQGNKIGLYAENSRVVISDSMVVKNEKGILSAGYSLTVAGSKFYGNDEYGVRLYGGGKIEKCGFKDNLVGIVLEQGRGSARIEGCRIELSRMDGIVSGAVNSEITDNLIASNGRNGIYLRDGANPNIALNDIINNRTHAVSGGGRVVRSFIAYNNGSPYYDDTEEKGRPDNVFSSSSSGLMKQILNADYISALSFSSVLR